jgi:hypothetical protein
VLRYVLRTALRSQHDTLTDHALLFTAAQAITTIHQTHQQVRANHVDTWPSQHSRCWHSPQAKGLPAACICTCTCASAQHLPQHACTTVLQYMSCMHVHVNCTCSIPAASSEWPDATHVCYTAYAAQRAAAMGSQLCYQCKVHRYTCRSVHATATATHVKGGKRDTHSSLQVERHRTHVLQPRMTK